LNISYFLNADSQCTNQPTHSLLAGDRNLTANGRKAGSGLLRVTSDINMDWSEDLHPRGGNLAFADGHVEGNKTHGLNSVFTNQPTGTNRLAVP